MAFEGHMNKGSEGNGTHKEQPGWGSVGGPECHLADLHWWSRWAGSRLFTNMVAPMH